MLWYFQGKPIEIDRDRVSVDDYNLILSYIVPNDTGTYYCVIKTPDKVKNISKEVIGIHTLAVVATSPQIFINTKQIRLDCNDIYLGRFLINSAINWYFNYPNLHSKGNRSIWVSKSGKYSCVVEDLVLNNSWITNFKYVQFDVNYILLHPMTSLFTIFFALAVLTLFIGFCVYKSEQKRDKVYEYSNKLMTELYIE